MNRVYLYDKPTCCGFIKHENNTTISCLIWGALSFYFAVLAFLGKSPFYSYISTVPLVAFGAANLLLGLMSLVALIRFILKRPFEIKFKISNNNPNFCYRSNRIACAVTLSVVAVLVTALVCFILFISEKQDYLDWCISSSTSYVNATYNEVNASSNITTVNLSTSTDYYNCDRLFQSEVKWGLMCLAVLLTVYLHWIVILNAVRSKFFKFEQFPKTITMLDPQMQPIGGEFSNIPPQKRGIISLSNVKPSKLKITNKFKLFQNKAVNGTKLPTQNQIEKSINDFSASAAVGFPISSEVVDSSSNQHGNIIHFEDNIHNSKEEVTELPENRKSECNSSKRPDSSTTFVNMSN